METLTPQLVSNLRAEIATLKYQRDELLIALKRAKERIEYDHSNHRSEYCQSVLHDIEDAINNCK